MQMIEEVEWVLIRRAIWKAGLPSPPPLLCWGNLFQFSFGCGVENRRNTKEVNKNKKDVKIHHSCCTFYVIIVSYVIIILTIKDSAQAERCIGWRFKCILVWLVRSIKFYITLPPALPQFWLIHPFPSYPLLHCSFHLYVVSLHRLLKLHRIREVWVDWGKAPSCVTLTPYPR